MATSAVLIRPSELLREKRREVAETVTRLGGSNPRVFGSVARGEDTVTSDIDLLIDIIPDERGDYFSLPNALTELLGVTVDVMSASRIKPDKHAEILHDAVPLSDFPRESAQMADDDFPDELRVSRTPKQYRWLADIVAQAKKAKRLSARSKEAYDDDEFLQYAADDIIIAAGEAARRITESCDLDKRRPDIKLGKLRDARNYAAHHYDGEINYDIHWNTLTVSLPDTARQGQALLDQRAALTTKAERRQFDLAVGIPPNPHD